MARSPDKGMPAGGRAFPHAQDAVLFIHLWVRVVRLTRLLARLLIGPLVGLPLLALLLLALLALALLLVTVLRGLRRVAVFWIVHRSPSIALPQRPGWGAAASGTRPFRNGLPAVSFIL